MKQPSGYTRHVFGDRGEPDRAKSRGVQSLARKLLAAAVSVATAFLSLSSSAYGFGYAEHAAISKWALEEACNQFERDHAELLREEAAQTRLSVVCGEYRRSVARCLGHLAAIAGDHIKDESEMVRRLKFADQRGAFFTGSGFNCSSFPVVVELEETKCRARERFNVWPGPDALRSQSNFVIDVRSYDCKQVPPGFVHQLKALGLALHNETHFPPDSRDALKSLVASLKTIDDPTEFFVNVAFALHFLEDSFAAGHIGVDRGSVYEQDYANAYHDDFNGAGRHLSRETNKGLDEWYGYGDKHLATHPTFYLILKGPLELAEQQQRAAIARQLGLIVRTGQLSSEASTQADIGEIEQSLSVAMSVLRARASDGARAPAEAVLSIPIPGMGVACFFADNCEKFEAIVRTTEPSHPSCKPLLKSEPHFVLFKCDDETSMPVRTAAVASLMAALAYWIDEDAFGSVLAEDALTYLPGSYRTLMADETEGARGGINKMAVAVEFDEWIDASVLPTRRLSSTEWGFSLAHRFDAFNSASATELGWNIRLSDGLCAFTRKLREKEERCQLKSKSKLSGRWGLVNRWSIIDREGNIVDSIEVGGYLDILRPEWAYRLLGVSLKATAGVDDVWRGAARRNIYGGGGISFDVHLGKNVIYFDVDKQWHRARHTPTEDSLRVMLGVRVMSIDLARRNR